MSNRVKFFDQEMVVEASETILDASIRNETAITYSCKNGRCETCRCKVISGISEAILDEIGLTSEEVAGGYILACVRRPLTDMVLEPIELPLKNLPKVKYSPARIHKLALLSDDVLCITLRLPPSLNFNFLPGQYIDVTRGSILTRSYSIASSELRDGTIDIHVRQVVAGQMSQYWFTEAREGDLLFIRGPLGTFFLRENSGRDLVFLATGTGIAPFKAMLEQLVLHPQRNIYNSISLFWGGRSARDLYLDFKLSVPNLRFYPVLSRSREKADSGRYVQDVAKAMIDDVQNCDVYAAGSEIMVRDASEVFERLGLPARQYHSDAFVATGIRI